MELVTIKFRIMQKSPFKYGKVVENEAFTNRDKEQKRVQHNIESNIHTTIISQRRWGKSSLVRKISKNYENNEKVKFVIIDMFKLRDEQDFLKVYLNSILKVTSTKVDEFFDSAKRFFSRLTPKFSFSTDAFNDFQVNFDMEPTEMDFEKIIDYSEKIAKEKNINLVVCIDEFQNLSHFKEPLKFQKKLRAIWQLHQNVTYILYGSKKHMLIDIFTNYSMPFYRFGEVMFLTRIATTHFVKFIQQQFKNTGKSISKVLATQIVKTANNHPDYVQQIANNCWNYTQKKATKKILEEAVSDIIDNNVGLFQYQIEAISNHQLKLLKAVCNGDVQLSSNEIIKKYDLDYSAIVSKSKDALAGKEILDIENGSVVFVDPIFEIWFRKTFVE